MRILLTGGSSFTGMWFAEALVAAGHHVAATMTADAAESYEGARGERVRRVQAAAAETIFGCRFGDERFLDVLGAGDSWDVLCHHAADVTDYRSPDFDTIRALGRNTNQIRPVMASLAAQESNVVLTGSVFEGGEGAGSEGLPHFSAYGLSKALTSEVWRFEASQHDVGLGKFVIPNPFGPFEEPRFTNYLMRCWFKGDTAGVRTPEYVRDNIHVSLLAAEYARFVGANRTTAEGQSLSPSGYVESQGRFAERVATEMRGRLGLACKLDLSRQTEFDEPRIRIGVHPAAETELPWSEGVAWDEFAAFYDRQQSNSA